MCSVHAGESTGLRARSAPALLRLERGIQFCEEAAQLVLLVEREFDLIGVKSITA